MLWERAVSQRIPLRRQIGEMLYLWIRNGIDPLAYHRMGLHRGSLAWSEKKEFASGRWYARRIGRINPRERRIATWNRIVAGSVLRTFHIPTPPFYGFVSPVNGQCADGRALRTPLDLAALVERFALGQACFKPVRSCADGRALGVRFRRDGGDTVVEIDASGAVVSLDAFWRDYLENARAGSPRRVREYGYVCEGLAERHPAVAALCGGGESSLRALMAQRSPGHWEMVGAMLRMEIAPAADGDDGIVAPVNLKTGRLGRGVRTGYGLRPLQEFDRHPSTDERIDAFTVPAWDDLPSVCMRACAVFPYLRFIGVDVAITPDGPIVLEIEADPPPSHQAHIGLGLRTVVEELNRARNWMPPR
jgi:hypothetical protein